MKVISYFSVFVLFALLFLGGLGVEKELVQTVGAIIVFTLIVMSAFIFGGVVYPKFFKLYLAFLGVLAVNFLWTRNFGRSLEYFTLFLGGGVFWLFSYNYRKFLRPLFPKIIIALGLIFAGLFFLNFKGAETAVSPWSLHLAYAGGRDHFHLGDLWALVLVLVSYRLLRERKLFNFGLAVLGIYILFVSQSRSAYFALGAGILVLLKDKVLNKKLGLVLLGLAVLLFIIVGANKPTIENRQYFLQALAGIYNSPFGVGMGNFSEISANPKNWLFGLSGFTSIAHNIILEVFAGVGVLGLVFVYWLYKVAREVWENKKASIVNKALFFALLVNFLFDSTYFTPSMLWLWFLSLGLAQDPNQKDT